MPSTHNTGDWNTGDYNTGDSNTRNGNTGNRNTGDYNTGNGNTGNSNTGNGNTGNWNTGNGNSGYRNTGDWNTGDYNTGYCNSITPDLLVFNKPCRREDWNAAKKPRWMYAQLTYWIPAGDMTDEEKKNNPSFHSTGGYLKVYSSLFEAYKDAWDTTTQEDRELTFKLPNYDPKVFKEVFGFDPEPKKLTIELTPEQLNKIKHLL